MGIKRGKKQLKISPLKPQHVELADDGAGEVRAWVLARRAANKRQRRNIYSASAVMCPHRTAIKFNVGLPSSPIAPQ
jgi:hypothetical protein